MKTKWSAEYKTVIKNFFIISLISIALGLLSMFLIYCIPTGSIIRHVKESQDIYVEKKIENWAGSTRYSHLSNTTDFTMINEAICRPFEVKLKNALLNPRFSFSEPSDVLDNLDNLLNNSENAQIDIFPRYWHGYLLYIIPLLLITNAGGIRMLMMTVQFILSISLIYEIGKRNRILMYLYAITALFINPVTSILSFQDADIYILMMIFSIIILKYDDWLKTDNRYLYLFLINGIMVCFLDFLTFPMVAWGIPLVFSLIISDDDYKTKTIDVIKRSLCWIMGYAIMWAGKWVLATLLTDFNVIADGISQAMLRSVGNGYTFIETLERIWESINDVPMLIIYLIGIIIAVLLPLIYGYKLNINSETAKKTLPLVLVFLGPFVWYFVVRNHAYIHPWFEYRELAVSLFCFLTMLFGFFTKD